MTERTRRRARWVTLAAFVALAAAAVWLAAGAAAQGDAEWATVRRDDLVVGVEVTGTLAAVQSVPVGPPQVEDQWDYKIAFLAPEGSQVRQGQPVVGFDTSGLEQNLAEKLAERDSADQELVKRKTQNEIRRRGDELQLAEAEARLRKAELKVKVPPELVSRHELAEARTDLALAKGEVASLEERLAHQEREAQAEIDALQSQRDRAAARLAESEQAIAAMTVPAPRDGTVIYASERGRDKPKLGDSVWRGMTVIELPDLSRMRAEGEIDEADAGRVASGQRVTLRLDAHPDALFTGRVRDVRGAVETRSRVDPSKVVRLSIDLDKTDPQKMRPGMRFVGTVELTRAAKVLLVPAAAVFNRGQGPVVYRKTRFGVSTVSPELGRRNEEWVEVRRGLIEGDRISRTLPEEEP
jgi:RND family efflux transporter MFP subunit